MNYLSYIEHAKKQMTSPVQYLVSGQTFAHEVLLKEIIRNAYSENRDLLIINDTKDFVDITETLTDVGYGITEGFSGVSVYNPLNIGTLSNISKLRELLETYKMTEKEKQKVISYLSFIQHLRLLEEKNAKLTVEVLAKEYSTYELVARKLDNLARCGQIEEDERYFLLNKYSECSAIAADLEDLFPLLLPFVKESGGGQTNENNIKNAVILQTGKLGRDQTLKQMIVQLSKFGIDEDNTFKAVIYIDNGCGSREELHYLCTELSVNVDFHIMSKDIFTTPASVLPEILNRFDIKVYGRHKNMSSATMLENELGEIGVSKSTYNKVYDRRFSSNKPLDVLFGRNKTEGYQTLAPVKEARYSKELISELKPNQIIMDVHGQKVMATV